MNIYEINFMAAFVISAISFGALSFPNQTPVVSSALSYLRSFSIGAK